MGIGWMGLGLEQSVGSGTNNPVGGEQSVGSGANNPLGRGRTIRWAMTNRIGWVTDALGSYSYPLYRDSPYGDFVPPRARNPPPCGTSIVTLG